jgi:hypothetical protein
VTIQLCTGMTYYSTCHVLGVLRIPIRSTVHLLRTPVSGTWYKYVLRRTLVLVLKESLAIHGCCEYCRSGEKVPAAGGKPLWLAGGGRKSSIFPRDYLTPEKIANGTKVAYAYKNQVHFKQKWRIKFASGETNLLY